MKKSLSVKLRKERVQRRLGYKEKFAIEGIEQAIDGLIEEAGSLIEPKAIFSSYKIYAPDWGVYVQRWLKEDYFQSFFLGRKLKHAGKAYLFAVTIGPKLEDAVKAAFAANDPFRGFVLDCIGSEAAESTAQALQELLEAKEGCKMVRYSPGYNDWKLEEQKKLFKLLKPKKIGVKLTESCLMLPRKSVSGIMLRKKGKK